MAVAFTAASAQQPSPVPTLDASATFVDTTAGTWTMDDKPVLARTPTATDLAKSGLRRWPTNFGLSFNCSAAASGTLKDCRSIYAVADDTDAAELTRALSPFARLTKASAALARQKAYRVTIDVAFSANDTPGLPRPCLPPFCIVEGAVPPPPPQPPSDPAVRAAMENAETCYDRAWQTSGDLRSSTEKAIRDDTRRPPSEALQARVLEYVQSRQTLMSCIAGFERTIRILPLNAHDRTVVGDQIKSMRSGYFGQTPYEMAILIGLLDNKAADTEQSYTYPY